MLFECPNSRTATLSMLSRQGGEVARQVSERRALIVETVLNYQGHW